MSPYFSSIAVIFLFLQIVILLIYRNATVSFFRLYTKKKHPPYPLLAEDLPKLIQEQGLQAFLRVFLSPFFMLKILTIPHYDNELDKAARRVRRIFLLFLASGIIEWILIFATSPNLHFRFG